MARMGSPDRQASEDASLEDLPQQQPLGEQVAARGWDWILDDETLRREREESLARAERVQEHWDVTNQKSNEIRAHLASASDDHGSIGGALLGSAESSGRDFGDHPFRSASALAQKMTRSQDRFFGNSSRRQKLEEELTARQHEILEGFVAADARVLEREQAMSEQQRKRTFNNAQKRNKQQKTLRELKREAERAREAIQEKMSARAQLCSPDSGAEKPKSASTSRLPSSIMNRPGDDIHMVVQQSHERYLDQLDQWRHFVLENEHRTDVQRRKTLKDVSISDLLDDAPHPMREDPQGRSATVRRTSKEMSQERSAAALDGKLERKLRTVQSPPMMRACPWHVRRDQCLQHAKDVEKRMDQKAKVQEAQLGDARHRYAGINAAISGQAVESGRIRDRKCAEALDRRSRTELANDNDLINRQMACAMRLDSEGRRMSELRHGNAHAKNLKIEDAINKRDNNIERKAESTRLQFAKIEQGNIQRVNQFLGQMAARAESHKFEEGVRDAAKRCKAKTMAFRRKTECEIAFKALHSMQSLKRARSGFVANERERRKTRGSLRLVSPSSTWTGGMFSPSGPSSVDSALLTFPVPSSPLRPLSRSQKHHQTMDSLSDGGSDTDQEGKERFLQDLSMRSSEWLAAMRASRD